MAKKMIRVFGDPVLREKSSDVKEIDSKVKKLIKDLVGTMKNSSGVGIAANQIGVLKKVAVVDIGDGLIELINPKIIKKEGEIEQQESCLSFYSLSCPVKRAEKISVITKNSKGQKVKIKAEGLLAKAIQHEIDHLNGILIIDHASNEDRRKILLEMNELRKQYQEGKI
ncbi:MAG: peptide deformylase [Actinomycetota bacterium]